nr:reverse transcriptase domain-containing protein [Tanacetum cinerariifolium]
MVNVIPLDYVDDVPVVEPNQHDDVPVVLKPVLVDENEDPEEDEFKEEEYPQKEEDDMEVDIEEDENEPELKRWILLTLRRLLLSQNLRMRSSDDLLPGLIRRDINSLFGLMASLSKLLYGHETTHALVEKRGKVKDEFYGKLILDLGNEVCPSVEQGMAAMEKMVEKLGNTEGKVECKKLKKELEEERGQDAALAARECAFARGKKGLVCCCNITRTEMKQLMTVKFYPIEEVQRIEHELWNLNVKKYNIVAYTQRNRKLEIKESWKERSESGRDFKVEIEVARCHKCRNVGHKIRYYKEKNVPRVQMLYPYQLSMIVVSKVILGTDAQRRLSKRKLEKFMVELMLLRMLKGSNVVTGTFLLNNPYAFVLFNLGSDRSFVDTRFSSMLEIYPVKIGASYEVELTDRRKVSTNTVLKGFTLNLVYHVFEIDLMPIELGMFDVIIDMDCLVKHDAVIVCGEKVVRIPYENKMLIVESEIFVPIIHDFPEVFPEELLGLPPSRQVEFQINLVSKAAPVARAPYRLALSEMRELSVQLQELLEKGFIHPSSSP